MDISYKWKGNIPLSGYQGTEDNVVRNQKMIPLVNALMLLNQEIVQLFLALSKSRIGKKFFSFKKVSVISS